MFSVLFAWGEGRGLLAALNKVDVLRCVRQNLRDGIGVFSPFCMGGGEGVASCFKLGRYVEMRKTELEG